MRVKRTTVPGLWGEYMWLSYGRARLLRVALLTAAFAGLGGALVWLMGSPARPFRGLTSNVVDTVVLSLAVAALVGMTFYVADAVRLCEAFCRQLCGRSTPWETPKSRELANDRGLDQRHFNELLDINVVAARTEAVGSVVFYPFVLLTLMFLARSRVFDRWEWPVPLVLIFLVVLGYAIWSVAALRRAAIRARRDALDRLQQALVSAKAESARGEADAGDGGDRDSRPRDGIETMVLMLSAAATTASPAPGGDQAQGNGKSAARESAAAVDAKPALSAKARVAQLEDVIAEISEIRRGAFAPLAQHPLIAGLAVVFGGTGAVKLMEAFMMLQ
jgi:hypothetical protein